MSIKIVTIIGARPQFIKAAAISRAIATRNAPLTPNSSRLTEIIIHTGQHYDDDMSAIFFRELEIPEPKYNLNIGSGAHGQQTGEMLAAIEKVLIDEKPDWVLVYGDTNSTLAGALAAAKLHIPIAHIEAGLRSFNRRMPEEINRVVTDHLSTLLFCPSQVAVNNLAAEGIPSHLTPHASLLTPDSLPLTPDSAHLTPHASPLTPNVVLSGDVMADALKFAVDKVQHKTDIKEKFHLQHGTYLLATIHRAENTDDPNRLGNIMHALSELAKSEVVVLPLHPRTKKILEANFPSLLTPDTSLLTPNSLVRQVENERSEDRNVSGSETQITQVQCSEICKGELSNSHRLLGTIPEAQRSGTRLKLLDPVGYFDMIALESSARIILTDSGGIQKEAYWLGVPCITLRDETEWIETVELGWNILTGADRVRIIEAVRDFKTPTDHPPLYGSGQAAEKILDVLCQKA